MSKPKHTTAHSWVEVQAVTARDVVAGGVLRLPRRCGWLGQSVLTLAAVRTFCVQEKHCFASAGKISQRAGVPLGTVRRHLAKLVKRRALVNEGRIGRPDGPIRRTVSFRLTKPVIEHFERFDQLPTWFLDAGRMDRFGGWPAALVYAAVVTERLHVERYGDSGRELDCWDRGDDVDRWRTSLTALVARLALPRKTVSRAQLALEQAGLVEIDRKYGEARLTLPGTLLCLLRGGVTF